MAGPAPTTLQDDRDRSAGPVQSSGWLSRTFVRHGDDFTDHGRHGHPSVDLPNVVTDEKLARSRILYEVKKVVVVPLDEHDIIDVHRRRIDRSDRDELTTLDPTAHGTTRRPDLHLTS